MPVSATPPPALVAATTALQPQVEALVDRVTAGIEEAMPVYRDLSVRDSGTLRESVQQNIHYLLATTISPGLRPHDLAASRATGRRRALQGLPMPEMLRSFRLGFALLWDAVAEEVVRSGTATPEQLVEVATALWTQADEYAGAATEAYRETTAEMAAQRENQRSALVEALITGRVTGQDSLWEIARKLELPRTGRFVAVAAQVRVIGDVALPGAGPALGRIGVVTAWRLLPHVQIGILSLPDDDRGNADMRLVDEVLHHHHTARAGISPPYSTLDQTPRAVYLAETAMNSIPAGQTDVRRFTDTPIASLVAAAPEAAVQAAQAVLGDLLRLPESEQETLLGTLEVWLRSGCSARETGRQLYCHPNTVRHRLRRIAEHTGRSTDDVLALTELNAALHALRLLPEVRSTAPTPATSGQG